jgi:uncharacterized repeat protein (TIGR03803 family)
VTGLIGPSIPSYLVKAKKCHRTGEAPRSRVAALTTEWGTESERLPGRKLQKRAQSPAERPKTIFALLAMTWLLPVGTFANVPACRLVGTVTTLHSFNGPDGDGIYGALVQGTDGNFYGAASSGGVSNSGTIFKITPTGVLTTLFEFNGASGTDPNDGAAPNGGLVQGRDGAFYGTTIYGGYGVYDDGTVFRITPDGVLTTLYMFRGYDGANPSHLILASDGAYYGTSQGDGNLGNVFKVTPTLKWIDLHGVRVPWTFYPFTVVHNFNGSDGAFPGAGVIQGSDGNFYGTTEFGQLGPPPSNRNGTVFEMTPAGVTTTLYAFNVPLNEPDTPNLGPAFKELIQGRDGAFYGTTPSNGAGGSGTGSGTVFKITPTQEWEYVNGRWLRFVSYPQTTLHVFNGSDGASPGGLTEGSDGNFYGVTAQGGPSGDGTLFLITPTGAVTTLHSFSGTDGTGPSSLIQGADGNFYGTTVYGGPSNDGTVFQLSVSLQCHSVP